MNLQNWPRVTEQVTIATRAERRALRTLRGSSVKVGDLLVAGERGGVAMKSEPVTAACVEMHRPGALLGKELEPLDSS